MINAAPPKTAAPLQQRLSVATEELRGSVDAVIEELPISVVKPSEFHRVLKIDRTLSSRLIRAIKLSDPLATLHRMPGLHGIRRMLSASSQAGVDPSLISRAEQALEQLESLVDQEVGTWQDLGAAIAGWLPEAREEFEFANRQTAFRAMCNIRGKIGGTFTAFRMLHPSADDPTRADAATMMGLNRLKRIRPGVPISFIRNAKENDAESTRMTLDGQAIGPDHPVPLLKEFCSQPTPEFAVQKHGSMTRFKLEGDDVGIGSMVDIYLGDVNRKNYPADNDPTANPIDVAVSVNFPVKTLVFDSFIHKDLWPGFDPEPQVYDTATRGLADPTDETREIDRLDMVGSFQSLGTNFDKLRIAEVAQYIEVVDFVCSKLGWDRSEFRAYRWRVEYPLIGTQYTKVLSKPGR